MSAIGDQAFVTARIETNRYRDMAGHADFQVRLNLSKMIRPGAISLAMLGRSCFWVLAKLRN